MLFGKRGKAEKSKTGREQSASDSEKSETTSEPIAADRALDFMAEMLRTLGERAFDVGPRTAARRMRTKTMNPMPRSATSQAFDVRSEIIAIRRRTM